MQIITNHKPRDIIRGYELSEKERAEFDYLAPDDLDTSGFIRYRGEVYPLADFVRIIHPGKEPALCGPCAHFDHMDDLRDWDAILTDSYFSGLLIRWAKDECTGEPDFDRVIIGRVYS